MGLPVIPGGVPGVLSRLSLYPFQYWGGGKGFGRVPLPSHCFLHPSIPDYTLSPFLASRAPGCAKKGIGKMIGVKGVVLLLWAKGGVSKCGKVRFKGLS